MNYQEKLNKFRELCELEKTIIEICEEMNISRRTLNNYEKMFDDFINFIKTDFNKDLYYQKIGNYYRVQFNRCDYKIIHWMYINSNISLDRKYKLFQDNWLNYKPKG